MSAETVSDPIGDPTLDGVAPMSATGHPRQRTRGLVRRAGPVLLIVAAVVAVVVAFTLAELLNAPVSVRNTIVLSFPIIAIVWLSRATSRYVPYHKTNRTLEERITNLVEMLDRVDHSLTIVTGSLNSAVYANPAVVDALRRLPKSTRINLIYTSDALDKDSANFIRELMARGVRPRRSLETVRHTVLVDDRDTKIEEFGVKDHIDPKRADYFFDDPVAARRVKAEIKALKTKPGQFPKLEAVLAR